MDKPIILRICHKFLKDHDGYDLEVQELVDGLKKDYDQYILFFCPKKNIADYIKKHGLVKKEIGFYHKKSDSILIPISYQKKYDNYLKDLFLIKNILSFHKKFKWAFSKVNPSIVHIHGTLLPQFFLAGLISKIQSRNVIVTHNIGKINQKIKRQKLHIVLLKSFFHNVFPLITTIVAVSNYSKSSFIFSKKVKVIHPFPAPREKIHSLSMKDIMRKNILKNAFTIKKKDFVYLYPARICDQKKQFELISSFLHVVKQFPCSKLIIVGRADKKYLEKIKKKIVGSGYWQKFCILESIAPERLSTIYSKSHSLVLPSQNEAFGRTIFEAVSHGLVIVANNHGGFSEVLKDSTRAIKINSNHIMSLTQAMIKARRTEPLTKDHRSLHQDYIKKIKELY